MEPTDDGALLALIRTSPVRAGLFVALPVLLAVAQVLNSVVNGLPLVASVPFAAVMVAYAVLYARYDRAAVRLRDAERAALRSTAD